VALWQHDAASSDTLSVKTMGKKFSGLLSALVGVNIEGEIDGARSFAQLVELLRVEMSSQRAGDVVKARLPHYGIVEEPLYQNHLGAIPDLLPCIQAALGAGKEAMRKGGADAATVEVDDVFALAQRKNYALVKSVGSVYVQQAGLPKQIEGKTLCREMTAQTSAGGVPDLKFLDQDRILETTLFEIAQRLEVVIGLLPIESDSLLKYRSRAFI